MRTSSRALGDLREPTEVVVSRTRALARNHARANRRLGRAGRAKDFTLPRTFDALQNLAALASLRVGDAQARHAELQLRIERGITRAQLHPAVRDRAEA